mgnify:CR=1 FL=1
MTAKSVLWTKSERVLKVNSMPKLPALPLDPTLLVGGLGPRLPATLRTLAGAFYPAAKVSFAQ